MLAFCTAVSKLLSWQPINFDRWNALAWVIDELDRGAANNLASTLPKLRFAWLRLREDLDRLLVPAGRPGTHAHAHYHSPVDPAERADAITACVVDYETALLFLDTTLDATARGVGTASSLGFSGWSGLVKAAEQGKVLTATVAEDVLYLQRTALYARNKGIVHPQEHIVELTHDNVGNVIFWRLAVNPDLSRMAELDDLLHDVRPDIPGTVRTHPHLALTWIGSVAGRLTESQRRLFEDLRRALGYWLPGPYEVAPTIDRVVEAMIGLIPMRKRGSIALRPQRPNASGSAGPEVESVPPSAPPSDYVQKIQEAIRQGEAGNFDGAEALIRPLVEEHPENALGHMTLAETLQKRGQYKEALLHYRIGGAIGIPYEDVRSGLAFCSYNIAAAAYSRGDQVEAVTHYREAIRLEPSDAEAHGHLALALSLRGDDGAALLEAERALERNAQLAEVRLDVALVLTRVNDLSAALDHLQAACDLRPEWAEPQAQLAVCLYRLGREEEGDEALASALLLDASNRGAIATKAQRIALQAVK